MFSKLVIVEQTDAVAADDCEEIIRIQKKNNKTNKSLINNKNKKKTELNNGNETK